MCRFYRRVNKERRDCSSAQLQQLSTHFNSTVPAKTIISKATRFSLIDFSCHIVALLQGTILVSFHTNTEMEILKKNLPGKTFSDEPHWKTSRLFWFCSHNFVLSKHNSSDESERNITTLCWVKKDKLTLSNCLLLKRPFWDNAIRVNYTCKKRLINKKLKFLDQALAYRLQIKAYQKH